MAAPSKSWSDIANDKIDVDSPGNTELFTFIRDDLIHTDERVGIPVAPANRQANHRHLGLGEDGSDLIELTPQENLIADGDNPESFTPGDTVVVVDKLAFETHPGGNDYNAIRSSSGLARGTSLTKAFVSGNIIKKIKSSGGQGRFTCSMHMKRLSSADGVVGGTLRFGLWDGSAFITGANIDLAFDTDLSNEYKRFYFISNLIARPTALNIRAQWVADPSDWDTVVAADIVAVHGGYMVTNGAGIARWDISHFDGASDAYSSDSGDNFYWWDDAVTPSQESV